MVPSKALLLRGALGLGCLALFLAQSYREVLKYTSGLTSTAISTYVDEGMVFPDAVVCARNSYKRQGLVTGFEQFVANTYSMSEVFGGENGTFFPPDSFNATEIHTYFFGRCYLLKASPRYNYTTWLSFNVVDPFKVTIYLVNKGQELCLITSECNLNYESVNPAHHSVALMVSVKRKEWPPKLCRADPDYNQYQCLQRVVREMIAERLPCLLVHQVQPFGNGTNKRVCRTKEEFKDAEQRTMGIYSQISNDAADVGCPLQCVTWVYSIRTDGYHKSVMTSTGITWNEIWGGNKVWMKLVSPKVEVMKEYEVYDLSGIIGSVGGSLGLFIGFSFLQCLMALFGRVEGLLKRTKRKSNREQNNKDIDDYDV